jgi:hypothetical protein
MNDILAWSGQSYNYVLYQSRYRRIIKFDEELRQNRCVNNSIQVDTKVQFYTSSSDNT